MRHSQPGSIMGRSRSAGIIGGIWLCLASCSPTSHFLQWGFSYPFQHCELGASVDCAHYPATPSRARIDTSSGYRFRNAPATATNSDSLFVMLVLSGGGTRSAAFSYGVLEELKRTIVPGTSRTLLDEVDVISSVSGGSFPAAFLALNGSSQLEGFKRSFLDWDAQSELWHSLLWQNKRNLLASKFYSRIDLAVEKWNEHLFHSATFNDLVGRRPYLMLNATDLAKGSVFPFVQEHVDPLCIDLAKMELARAVGASGAFPPLLNPLTIENHANQCAYVPPEWAVRALNGDERTGGGDFRAAEELLTYTNGASRPYVHLTDGGIGDNIGARNIARILRSRNADVPLATMLRSGKTKRVVVIVVNAATESEDAIDKRPYAPGILSTIFGAIGAPMDNYSRASIADLWDALDSRQQAEEDAVKCPFAHCNSFYSIGLSFATIKDADERLYFQRLPTSYALDSSKVNALIGRGGSLLRSNVEFNRLLCDMNTVGWASRESSDNCARAARAGTLYVRQ